MNFLYFVVILMALGFVVLMLYELRRYRMEKAYTKEIEDAINRSLAEATAARLSKRSIPPKTPVTFNEFNPAPRSAK